MLRKETAQDQPGQSLLPEDIAPGMHTIQVIMTHVWYLQQDLIIPIGRVIESHGQELQQK